MSVETSKITSRFFRKAALEAAKSLCLRSKCGAIIVKDGEIIGRGYNAPPKDKVVTRCQKSDLPEDFPSDKHCCLHAEQRAVFDALKSNPEKLAGSTIYFVRVDDKGDPVPSGDPRCTICSKIVLDVGIAEFIMWQEEGVCSYSTGEFNAASFRYR